MGGITLCTLAIHCISQASRETTQNPGKLPDAVGDRLNPGTPYPTNRIDASPLEETNRSLNTESPVITGIKVRNLSKSSQSRRENAAPGPSRLRRLRLTDFHFVRGS